MKGLIDTEYMFIRTSLIKLKTSSRKLCNDKTKILDEIINIEIMHDHDKKIHNYICWFNVVGRFLLISLSTTIAN